MKRPVIRIDEKKCNGCGLCVPACHEGAIRIIDGKAKLPEDSLCDGLGACLGECPQGAITIESREAEQYDEIKALRNIMKEGDAALQGHLQHLKAHGQTGYLEQALAYLEKGRGIGATEGSTTSACGCPGSMTRDFHHAVKNSSAEGSTNERPSQLAQWPVQLRLLNPHASFFQEAALVVSADCVPFSYADFHQRFLKNKVLVVFCPKLDEDLDSYVEKLTEIIRVNRIKGITVVRMEVPCCGGTLKITEEAVRRSGKAVMIEAVTISLRGEIINN